MSANHWDDPDKKHDNGEMLTPEGTVDKKVDMALQRLSEHPNSQKEWRLIEKVVTSLNIEQRRARRWGIFFKLLTFAYLFALLGMMGIFERIKDFSINQEMQSHVALVEINGVIMEDSEASADLIVSSLRAAFEAKEAEAIIVRINSPGGSPVQAGYVNDEINRLKSLYPEKKVYAVISDIGASGGYYIAVAADEIYADKASLVGSIGVTASSFGFVELMDNLGVERRIFTSGDNKAFLDPFSPLKTEETEFWQSVLSQTHQQFIEVVKAGRGERLADDDSLFTGLVWNGEQALDLGLIDGLGSTGFVAREIVGNETLMSYSFKPSPFWALADRLGVSIGKHIALQLSQTSVIQPR